MKTTIVCLFAAMCANAAFAGAFEVAELPSVLTVAPTTTAVVVAPAPVVVEAAPVAVLAPVQSGPVCANGKCGTRLYSVQTEQNEQHRNRLFGGQVVRRQSRTVVKPVRR
jgi:hypothetical protein